MKKAIIIVVVLGLIGVAFGAYMFFAPQRDVQATAVDQTIDAKKLVDLFLIDLASANKEYLSSDGDSKVLVVSGTIHSIIEDGLGQKVILLKNVTDKMGVSCTFTKETVETLNGAKVGDKLNIKGVIRSGAEYDEDLDLAEDVIMEKCAVI